VAYALLTSASAGSTGGNNVTTASVDTTGATLLVLCVSCYGTGAPTVSDSKGNTWTSLTTRGATAIGFRMHYCVPTSVGTGHTFTASSSGLSPSICAAAFSGAAAVPFEAESGGTSATPGSITPSEANELLVTGVSWYPSGTVSLTGGFTLPEQVNYLAANHIGCGLAYLIQTSAAAANPTWSSTGGFSEVASAMAAFKAAAGGGGISIPVAMASYRRRR